ncbi:hypothetical protein [Mycolicibacterium arenosum]|uniref:Keratin associated protein n=1 Tax=Mycolicibacterium arenosum TaxID=2952157 RepID=A0ABT1MBC0_9MYCO|nr:hypothetical protein [Mycolicibacterium sp. CAU 1645]MCP9276458.1 hypothetical protein [Mycolicibacterium sp. CAU 1645]
MAIKNRLFAALLATAAAGAVLATAPMAAAADSGTQQTCSSARSHTQCQSPGNVQIKTSPAPVKFHPYGGLDALIGSNEHGR